MRRIIPILLLVLLFACDDREPEPIDPLVGTWEQSKTTTIPSWEGNLTVLDDWTLTFGQDGQFSSAGNPYLITDAYTTWSNEVNPCLIELHNLDSEIEHLTIADLSDTVMTVWFICFGGWTDDWVSPCGDSIVGCIDPYYAAVMTKRP